MLQNTPDINTSQEYRELHQAVQGLLAANNNTQGIGYVPTVATNELKVKLLESVLANAALHITSNGYAGLASTSDLQMFCNGFSATAGSKGDSITAKLSGSLVTTLGSWLGAQPGVTAPIANVNPPAKYVQWLGQRVDSTRLLFQFNQPTAL
jgi:hypothetical protein